MKEFKNILVVRADRMGDVVLTIPSLRALKKKFPSARLTVWVAAYTRELVEGLPFVDEVLCEDRNLPRWRAYLKLIAAMRQRRFDLAVIYHTKQRTNAACFLAGIPFRLGYKNNKWGFLLNHPVEDRRHFGEKHEVYFCLDLLREIGCESHDITLELPHRPDAETWADDLWDSHSLMLRPVVALHPDASCMTRRWPPELFARLAERISVECGARIVIVGSHTTKPIAREILNHFHGDAVDLTGSLSLPQTASVFKRCRLVVSADTGPAHVAAAVGTPLITLFLRKQPGINPERWAPFGDKCRIIKNKPGEEILLDRAGNVVSGRFDSISPDEVFAMTREFI